MSDHTSRLHFSGLLLAVLVGVALYVGAASATYRIGFPLDDSWIHQTFARTLAETGEWGFRSGAVGAGSTAPLWSALLVPGHLLRVGPYVWTYLLGGLVLLGIAVISEWATRQITSSYRPRLPWVGLFMALEWHLLWAAASGMETALQSLLVTVVLGLVLVRSRRGVLLGVVTGASIWVRPDGITLAGPALLHLLLAGESGQPRIRSVAKYLATAGLLTASYIAFNLVVGGTPLPSTFYAKQAEYAAWQVLPWTGRVAQVALQFLAGPAVVLLPGAVATVVRSVRERRWERVVVAVWILGYVAVYASRLPVYQHGRYLMPAMPAFFLLGLIELLQSAQGPTTQRNRALLFAWRVSVAALLLAFLAVGANRYGADVAVIETEMVQTAEWIAANIPPDALLAAHDIGALGYFDKHAFVDLAGLVSPEVIPFVRDEDRLAAYLDNHGADYLVAFPDFYPRLTRDLPVVYQTGSAFAIREGYSNMTVYRWIGRR